MQFSIQTNTLSSAISKLIPIVEKIATKPVLNNVAFIIKDKMLTVSATDQNIFISRQIPVNIDGCFSFTAPARLLSDILRKIQDENISLALKEEDAQLVVLGKHCEFILPILPIEEFPNFEQFVSKHYFKINASDFALLLEKTVFSVSNESTRYNLTGVCMQNNDQLLTFVSTDCHRLSVSSCAFDYTGEPFDIIIPKKTSEELIKLSKESQQQKLKVFVHDRLLKVENDNTCIISALVDGKFPNYIDLLPKNNDFVLSIDAKILGQAIERVSIVTVDSIEKLRSVQLQITNAFISVCAFGNAYSRAKEKIILDDEKGYSYTGNDITIGFNPKYLLDALKACSFSNIKIKVHNSMSPIIIIPNDNELSILCNYAS